jgi:hypothetical protein
MLVYWYTARYGLMDGEEDGEETPYEFHGFDLRWTARSAPRDFMGHGSSEVLMLGDKTIQLGPLDDSFHAPQTPDPLWNETTWFSFSVPERAIQGYVYPWVRPSRRSQ